MKKKIILATSAVVITAGSIFAFGSTPEKPVERMAEPKCCSEISSCCEGEEESCCAYEESACCFKD